MKKIIISLSLVLLAASCGESNKTTTTTPTSAQVLKVLVWNIQNGMYSDQGYDYENFVRWVKNYNPDVCIWCESESNYKTNSKENQAEADKYLPNGWGELAERYGHSNWVKSGDRDGFSQVITSKHQIIPMLQSTGSGDCTISHGMGWYRIIFNKKIINFVSLHLWPQKYAFGIPESERESSSYNNGGDYYRQKEITWICQNTIERTPDKNQDWWLMAGDFNAQSRLDNNIYGYAEDDTRLLVHNYVLDNTVYKDVIKEKYPSEFKTTTSGDSRIDFVYCSPAMMQNVTYADVIKTNWMGNKITQDELKWKHPSDHLPILMYVLVK